MEPRLGSMASIQLFRQPLSKGLMKIPWGSRRYEYRCQFANSLVVTLREIWVACVMAKAATLISTNKSTTRKMIGHCTLPELSQLLEDTACAQHQP